MDKLIHIFARNWDINSHCKGIFKWSKRQCLTFISCKTTQALPFEVERVWEDERTHLKKKAGLDYIPLYECGMGFRKQSFLFFLVWFAEGQILSSYVCDLKSGPPSLLCFAVCKWLSRGGVCLCDRICRHEVSDVGVHPLTFLFCFWNHGGGFDGLLRQDLVDLSDSPLLRDCPLYPVLLDAPRDTFLAYLRGKVWRSTKSNWHNGQVE